MNYHVDKDGRELVYLTATYSPVARGWFIEKTYPGFITKASFKTYIAIPGKDIVYMVAGFEHHEDTKQFAIDYHEAKRDGIVHRVRLD